MGTLSGVVRDSSGTLASRLVRAYRRDTGAYVGQSLSDPSTGAYSITTASSGQHFVVAHDSNDVDVSFDKVVFLAHCDGTNGSTTFTDSSSYGRTVTANGNASISTAQSKFGGASANFDGSGDYLSVSSSSDFQLFGADFTVEAWVYPQNVSSNQAFIEFYQDVNNRWNISFVSNIDWYTLVGGSGSQKISASAPSTNAWHHVALVKNGSTFTLYVDGSSVGTSTTTSYPTGGMSLYVGSGQAGSNFQGYIDEMRITKGLARYTANFTPASAAFKGLINGGTENAVILDMLTPV